jgi:hypothetical protein
MLYNLIPYVCKAFLNDISIKGAKSNYNEEEVASKVRRHILKYLQNINKVLINIELVGGTIFYTKL